MHINCIFKVYSLLFHSQGVIKSYMTISAIPPLCGVALLIMGSAAAALPARSFERAELFATCTGRMPAIAARQQSHGEDGAQQNALLCDEFEMLLEAVQPSALNDGVPEAQLSKWRSRGWVEIANHLNDLDTSFDARRASRAKHALERQITNCRDVLL